MRKRNVYKYFFLTLLFLKIICTSSLSYAVGAVFQIKRLYPDGIQYHVKTMGLFPGNDYRSADEYCQPPNSTGGYSGVAFFSVGQYDISTMTRPPNSMASTPIPVYCKTNDAGISEGNTMESLVQEWINTGGLNWEQTLTFPKPISQEYPVCLAIMGEGGVDTPLDCTGISSPVDTTCTVTPSDIVFDHGTISSTSIDGSSSSQDISVKCSTPTDFTVFVGTPVDTNAGVIDLLSDHSLFSTFQVNSEKVGSDGVIVKAGGDTTSVKVTSILNTNSTTIPAGDYSGLGIIIISPQ